MPRAARSPRPRAGPTVVASPSRPASKMVFEPAIGIGLRRPDASGSPSSMRMHSMPLIQPLDIDELRATVWTFLQQG